MLPNNSSLLNNELESIAQKIDLILKKASAKFIPKKLVKNINNIILSSSTIALRCHVRHYLRKLDKNRYNINFVFFKSQLKLIRKMYLDSLSQDLRNFYANIITNTACNNQVYDLIRKTKSKHVNINNIDFILDRSGNNLTDPDKFPDSFCKHFLLQHELTHSVISEHESVVDNSIKLLNYVPKIPFLINHSFAVLNKINNLLPSQHQNILTSASEVQKIINSKINKKSAGLDKMPIFLFKLMSPEVILFFTLFNHLLACYYFPQIWKSAKIIPIPKIGKDIHLINNWRPISQLNTISKIFEKII